MSDAWLRRKRAGRAGPKSPPRRGRWLRTYPDRSRRDRPAGGRRRRGRRAVWAFTILPRSLPTSPLSRPSSRCRGTKVYDDNDELITESTVERRIFVPLAQIPRSLRDAVLAIEDRRFYAHCGLDRSASAAPSGATYRRGGSSRAAAPSPSSPPRCCSSPGRERSSASCRSDAGARARAPAQQGPDPRDVSEPGVLRRRRLRRRRGGADLLRQDPLRDLGARVGAACWSAHARPPRTPRSITGEAAKRRREGRVPPLVEFGTLAERTPSARRRPHELDLFPPSAGGPPASTTSSSCSSTSSTVRRRPGASRAA